MRTVDHGAVQITIHHDVAVTVTEMKMTIAPVPPVGKTTAKEHVEGAPDAHSDAVKRPRIRALGGTALVGVLVYLGLIGLRRGLGTPIESIDAIGAFAVALGSGVALALEAAGHLAKGKSKLPWSTTLSAGAVFLGSLYLLFKTLN